MRSFHEIENLEKPNPDLILPTNVILMASHGSRAVPESAVNHLSDELLDPIYGEARLKDYSDFAAGLILENFMNAKNTIVTPPRYGRIAGDANRELANTVSGDPGVEKGKETFRTTTMGGVIPVWKKDMEPDSLQRVVWLDENQKTYQEKIIAAISSALGNPKNANKPILVVDLHDTGDVRLLPDGSAIPVPARIEKYGRTKFWEAIISDLDGKTTRPNTTEAFMQATRSVYSKHEVPSDSSDILVNEYYKGGYITRFAGIEVPELLLSWNVPESEVNRINAIQLEIARHRYMTDEIMQTIDTQAIRTEAIMLQEILNLTINSLRNS